MQGHVLNLPPGKGQDEEPTAFCASFLTACSKVKLAEHASVLDLVRTEGGEEQREVKYNTSALSIKRVRRSCHLCSSLLLCLPNFGNVPGPYSSCQNQPSHLSDA